MTFRSNHMPITEVADLMAGCTKAGLGGLELLAFLKEQFGPNKTEIDDLTPEEGARLRTMLDKIIDGNTPAPKGQSA